MWNDVVIIARKQSEEGILSAEAHVPANATWFDGHFPGWPVLPGIAQINMVYEVIRHTFDVPVRVVEVSRVRFRQMIVPDDRLSVMVESRAGNGRYAFRIMRGDEVVCTGTMTVANPQPQATVGKGC